MLSVIDRYVIGTYGKYYVLFMALLSFAMFPALLRFRAGYGYVLPVLSVAGSAAACAALLEMGFLGAITTLQRYGVRYAQFFRPLILATVAPLAIAAFLAVIVAVVRSSAVYWSVLALGSAALCVVTAARSSWAAQEAGIAKACLGALACQAAVLAVGLALAALRLR